MPFFDEMSSVWNFRAEFSASFLFSDYLLLISKWLSHTTIKYWAVLRYDKLLLRLRWIDGTIFFLYLFWRWSSFKKVEFFLLFWCNGAIFMGFAYKIIQFIILISFFYHFVNNNTVKEINPIQLISIFFHGNFNNEMVDFQLSERIRIFARLFIQRVFRIALFPFCSAPISSPHSKQKRRTKKYPWW